MTDLDVSLDAGPGAGSLWHRVGTMLDDGARFIGMFGTADAEEQVRLTVALADGEGVQLVDHEVGERYPSLTDRVPAAFAYERVVHDLFGAHPVGHPRLDPLMLAGLVDDAGRPARPPAPGSGRHPDTRLVPQGRALPRYLRGAGLFTIPYGPVRNGVTESMEYLVETPGEDIPRLQIRVYAKHRGVQASMEGHTVADGVLQAERVEGTASVAHATAYCQALERLAGTSVPPHARMLRLVHAELERIAGHLEVMARECEGAALAVGIARFTAHKEEIQRIRHLLGGNRFGRGVFVPGGTTTPNPELLPARLAQRLARLRDAVVRDRDLLMVTSSFLDRLRGTGVLEPARAREWAAVGPVGRGSGVDHDVRREHPYDAYLETGVPLPSRTPSVAGDVQARVEVRWAEIETSFALVERGLQDLPEADAVSWAVPVRVPDGRAAGTVEGPQGETVYVVAVRDGRLRRVWVRTPSFHNLMLMHDVFHTDVLTDFVFIEASFAISNAGVVM